jgi:hypothetical protein
MLQDSAAVQHQQEHLPMWIAALLETWDVSRLEILTAGFCRSASAAASAAATAAAASVCASGK